MNVVAAGKLALCICTGAAVGAGVNEARHNADKPKTVKTASKAPARKVVQFPCEPYIVQDQMMRDAQIPSDFEVASLDPDLILPGGESGGGGNGDGGGGGGNPNPPTHVPEPAALALFGLGAAGLIAGRRFFLRRKI